MPAVFALRQQKRMAVFVIGFSLLAFYCQAQTVHAILVADTKDPLLYKACKRDVEIMHRQFIQLAAAINYQLSEQVIWDDEFSRKRFDDVLRDLSPNPNDILFLYYTGHGYNASQRTGRFPVLLLEKDEQASEQNPGLMAVHQALKAKHARLCITMGDCCNNLVNNMRGMVKKTISPKALTLTDELLNEAYRTLFLNMKGDALIASSQPPQQACAHPDSGSFYTRSFDEALELASRYNKNISWLTLLRDAQTRLTRHQATRAKQSIYEVNVVGITPTATALATTPGPDLSKSDSSVTTSTNLSFDQMNRHLNELTDKTLSSQQRLAAMNRLTGFFSKNARIDIYVNSTLGDVQPIETFVRRLYLNADHIQQINLIERLSEVAADGQHYKRAAIQEVW
ncbi:caspase family protein [Spirosoma endbachense]|uniref:Peptidase C14 caspase domain-containing protein n=1 Tax=Spirosoma endbachense TaxID=2666025 RepID=A0A6P1VSE5_9BACT|nr:caspase family protein [Spirosoma endbachense]QHV96151.1 hypothetical protein GJR95_14535 [Spirosoma endbachense]